MSSISENSNGDKHEIHVQCGCGAEVKQYTSKTAENPGRPFFGCLTMKKWVEEAMLEEIEEMSSKIHMVDGLRSTVDAIENELVKLKTEIDVTKEMVYELHKNGLEERRELKMMKLVCILCIVLTVFSILFATIF